MGNRFLSILSCGTFGVFSAYSSALFAFAHSGWESEAAVKRSDVLSAAHDGVLPRTDRLRLGAKSLRGSRYVVSALLVCGSRYVVSALLV